MNFGKRNPHRSSRRARRGVVLILALLCLAVLAVVQGSLVKSLVAQRRLLREQAQRHQARWLAESGLERAVWRLRSDPAYRGETWELSADDFGGEDVGFRSAKARPFAERKTTVAEVEIEIQNVSDDANARLVLVRGSYPRDLPQRVMYRKEPIFVSNVGKQP
jgi:hypothetical protein